MSEKRKSPSKGVGSVQKFLFELERQKKEQTRGNKKKKGKGRKGK